MTEREKCFRVKCAVVIGCQRETTVQKCRSEEGARTRKVGSSGERVERDFKGKSVVSHFSVRFL